MAKDKDYIKLIHTSRWLKLRALKLKKNPLCERCMDEGRISAACEVHHVEPVERALSLREKEQLMFDYHNLRSLCHDCHVKTHTEMGKSGKVQARSRAQAQLDRFRMRLLGDEPPDKEPLEC